MVSFLPTDGRLLFRWAVVLVAAHLWGLWTVAPWAEGLTRLVVIKLKAQDRKLHTHILHYFPLFVYNWNVVVTYQPCAHTCNSCKRYVVVTYRSTICTSCKKHVSYTCKSGELIQIRTEQLQNKRIFIYFPYYIFKILLGAIFITNSTNYYINPPFSIDLCSKYFKSIDSLNKFSITINYYYRAWL